MANDTSNGYKDYPGVLSDSDIKSFWGNGISIFTSEKGDLAFNLDKQLQYGSIDLRFRHECKRIKLKPHDILTYAMVQKHDYTTPFELKSGEKLTIAPGEIVFTTTLETIQLSEEFAGIITGRSSIARLGVMIHCCQEYINPGHGQPIPLQLVNLGPCSVELDLSVPVCQLVIFKLRTPATGRYKHGEKSKYSNEIGPQNSKIYEDATQDTIQGKKDNNTIRFNSIKRFVSTYILPFLPSLIMLLFITPFINNHIEDKSILDIMAAIKNTPMTMLIGIVLLVIYIWVKRGDKK